MKRAAAAALSALLVLASCTRPGPGPSAPPATPLTARTPASGPAGAGELGALRGLVVAYFEALNQGDVGAAVSRYDPGNRLWRAEMSAWLTQYTSQQVTFEQVRLDTASALGGEVHATAHFRLDGAWQSQPFVAARRGAGWYLLGPDPGHLGQLRGGQSKHFRSFFYSWDAASMAGITAAADGVFDGVMADFQVAPGDALHQVLYTLEVAPTATTMPGQVRDRLGATDLSAVYLRTPSIWTIPDDGGLSGAAGPVIAHELTHVLGGSFDLAMPSWLTEGAATWEQERWTRGDQLRLDRDTFHALLISGRRLPTLDEITVEDQFASSGIGSTIAYAESESLVAYLVQRWDRAALRKFMEGHGHGLSQEQASLAAFGQPLSQIFSDWRDLVRSGNPPF